MKNSRSFHLHNLLLLSALLCAYAAPSFAQSGSTRPRRVNPTADEPTATAAPVNTRPAAPASPATAAPVTTRSSAPATTLPARRAGFSDTTRAYALLQQRQFAAAAQAAREIAQREPDNDEAWKIVGFAEFNQQRYTEAAEALQRALDLQRAANAEDQNTADALAQAYVRTENFARALPLLVAATARAGAPPDAELLYLRGLAEYRTDKREDAERSFSAATRVNARHALSLFYLGRLAAERNDLDGAIVFLNRATTADPRMASGWALLTTSYLRRAAAATDAARRNAEYTNAIRAGENLFRLANDAAAATLYGQALIGAEQYARAATVLERAAAAEDASGPTLYLLGVAHSRARNFPRAITALQRAAARTPDDANIYRELGYAYEITRQYREALAAYERGLALAPDAEDLGESIARVRPQVR